jgi:gamma-glutamylcyclotransferase (GGCT)/AIG2-like uncharacterized protein YtfP
MPITTEPRVTDLLFVYGTLMQGFQNGFARHLHANATLVGPANFRGRLYRISYFPGAIFDADAPGLVHGEIWRLHNPGDILQKLDHYEGVLPDDSGLYIRREIPAQLANGTEILVQTFLYNRPLNTAKLVESGRFNE